MDINRVIEAAEAVLKLHADGVYVDQASWDGPIAALRAAVQSLRATPTSAPPAGPAHPDDAAVDQFAALLKAKLAKARAKGRSGWRDPSWSAADINRQMHEHAAKGDPLDVAAYAMFLALRGEATTAAASAPRLAVEPTYHAAGPAPNTRYTFNWSDERASWEANGLVAPEGGQ